MTQPTAADEQLARLQHLIDRCDPEALLDLIEGRRDRTIARLRKALAELRASLDDTAAAHERLARALTPPA